MNITNVDLCPICQSDEISTYESRNNGEFRFRRKKCMRCGNKYVTLEILKDDIDVIENKEKELNEHSAYMKKVLSSLQEEKI